MMSDGNTDGSSAQPGKDSPLEVTTDPTNAASSSAPHNPSPPRIPLEHTFLSPPPANASNYDNLPPLSDAQRRELESRLGGYFTGC